MTRSCTPHDLVLHTPQPGLAYPTARSCTPRARPGVAPSVAAPSHWEVLPSDHEHWLLGAVPPCFPVDKGLGAGARQCCGIHLWIEMRAGWEKLVPSEAWACFTDGGELLKGIFPRRAVARTCPCCFTGSSEGEAWSPLLISTGGLLLGRAWPLSDAGVFWGCLSLGGSTGSALPFSAPKGTVCTQLSWVRT